MSYDVLIIHGVKDSETLPYCVDYIKRNVENKRNIYIISQDPNHQVFLHPIFSDIIIRSEKENFPFTIQDVHSYIQTPSRNGWYFQQLLKLYAGFAIPEMLEDYVVIDSDTIFLKPIYFKSNNKYLFNIGSDYIKGQVGLMNPEEMVDYALSKVIDSFSGGFGY